VILFCSFFLILRDTCAKRPLNTPTVFLKRKTDVFIKMLFSIIFINTARWNDSVAVDSDEEYLARERKRLVLSINCDFTWKKYWSLNSIQKRNDTLTCSVSKRKESTTLNIAFECYQSTELALSTHFVLFFFSIKKSTPAGIKTQEKLIIYKNNVTTNHYYHYHSDSAV